MPSNPFSHVDQRVGDLARGVEFYGAFIPQLGFSHYEGGQDFRSWTVPAGSGPSRPWFGITEAPGHAGCVNRIAFWVDSREEVDRLARVVAEAGAREVSGPKLMSAYGPTYYAVFFDDPWGNPLEILHWTSRDPAPPAV
ncbi:MAG: VOC family protein [Acidobacteriota bacterium]